MRNKSYWTTSKTWQTNLAAKKLPHVHDTNGQQIPEASADVTSLVFPAIGAILILLFGGFLLSSANSCCHVDASNKKKNGDESEGIDFPYMDNIYFPKPFPVLQQENNDVVDAVMETYSDLPQYAPMNELLTSLPGIARHAQQTETRDACVSPIRCLNSVSTLPGNQDGHAVVSNQEDIHGNHGDSNDHVIDHKELNDDMDREQTRLDCTIHVEHNEDDDVSDESSTFNMSSGIGTCSIVNTPALSVDSGLAQENTRGLYIPIQLRKSKRTRSRANGSALSIDSGRMSNDMRKPPVSDHLQEIKKTLNASFGLGEMVTNKPLPLDDRNDKEDHEPMQSASCRRFSEEKWIDSAKQSGVLTAKTASYQWKRPMKLSKQDRLEILKRLQPNYNTVGGASVTTDKEEAIHSGKVEQRNIGGYVVNTYGGRLSCLKVERAPSSMCIHGNICQYNCKSNQKTGKEECEKDDSGRGASYLGVTRIQTPRGVGKFADTTRGNCEIDSHPRGEGCFVSGACEESMRGASGFDGCTSPHTRGARTDDEHMRGASGFDGCTSPYTRGVRADDALMPGASAFAENDSNVRVEHEQPTRESDTLIRGASAFTERNDPAEVTTEKNPEILASQSNTKVINCVTSKYSDHHDLSLHTDSIHHQENLTNKPDTLHDVCPTLKHGDDYKNNQFKHQTIKPSSKYNEKDASMEYRGASGFGQSYADCLSIAGTASVTLSMAVQSEREDPTLASIALKLQPDGTEYSELVEGQQARYLMKENDKGKKKVEGQDKVRFYEGKDDTEFMKEQQDLELQNEEQHEMHLRVEEEHNETTLSVNHRIFNVNSDKNVERTMQPFCDASMTKNWFRQRAMKSQPDSNPVREKNLSSWHIEPVKQPLLDSNAMHNKSISLSHTIPVLSNKPKENNKIPNPPQRDCGVRSHPVSTGSHMKPVQKEMETTETTKTKPRGIVTTDVISVANVEHSNHNVAMTSLREDTVAKDRKSRDAVDGNITCDVVATGNASNDNANGDGNSFKLRASSGKLSDVIIHGQRSLEFSPSRSSTPYDNDVKSSILNVPMTTKVSRDDERIENKDGGALTSGSEKNVLLAKVPKMTLGKNPQALSGLLRALQREKRKKDCVTDNDCVTSNECVTKLNSDFANGAVSVTDSDCAPSNNRVTAKTDVGDNNCVTDKNDCVTVSSVGKNDCITHNNNVTNKDNVTVYNSVTNRDCVSDSNNSASKSVPEKSTDENTLSDSPEGSDVTHTGRRKQVVGKLKVCLFYSNNNANKPVLYMTVLKASSLRQELVHSNDDLYIQMHVSTRDDKVQQTKSVSILSNTAVFNHLFQVHDITLRELRVSTIKLVLVSGHSEQEEAVANIPLAELVARDKIKKTYLLKRYSPQTNKINKKDSKIHIPVGSLYLGLKYNSVDEKLLVNITKARGLPSMTGWGQTDPYVILTVKDDGKIIDEKVTCTKWNQRNPQFDANFVLEISRERIVTTSILLRVMNNSANHSLIGAVKIGMDSLEDSGQQHWESILDQNGVHDERWHKLFK